MSLPSIPLAALLIPYLLVVVIAGIFLFFNLFHLRRYGVKSFGTWSLMMIYTLVYLAIVGLTGVALLGSTDWQQQFEIEDLAPNVGSGFNLNNNF